MSSITLYLDLNDARAFADESLARLRHEGFQFTTLAAEQARWSGWLAALCELDNATRIGDPKTPRSLADFVVRLAELKLDADRCVVARQGDCYVGYSVLDDSGAEASTIDQSWTGVRPGFRRRGIATALKALGVDLARAGGFSRIRTVLRATNSAAVALNQRFGYRPDRA